MSGASRDVLPILMFCLCQLVTGVSTQATSGHGNSFSGSQKHIPIDAEVQYLVPLTGSKDKQQRDGKTLFSGHRDSPVMGSKPTITPPSNRNTNTQDAVVPEGGRHRQVPTTAATVDSTSHLTPRTPETSSPTSWSAGRPGVSGKRLNINLEQNNRRSSSPKAPVLPGTSWTQNIGASSKAPYWNFSERLGTDVKSLNETDLVSFVNDSFSINFVNETYLVNFVNETETVADNRQEDNSTVLLPESPPQLSHTKIVATSQKDKASRRNSVHVKDSRQSNTKTTPTILDPLPLSRQPIKNTAAVLDPRPVSRQPITNNTPTSLEPRPVSRHTSRPSTSAEPPTEFIESAWEGDSSASKRTAGSAEPAAEPGLADAQKENDGELEYEDTKEEESNDTSTCTTCSKSGLTEEQVKRIRIDMFKELLAQKMGIELDKSSMQGALNDARTKASLPKLPQAILEQTIKENLEESEKDEFYARDQEIIIAGQDLRRDCPRPEVTGCYRFHIKDKVKHAVAEAKLWFYKLKDVNDVKGQTFKVIDLNTNNSRPQQGPVIGVKDDVYIKEGWVQMDVTGEIHKWLDTGRTTPALAIRCPTCGAKSYTSLFGIKQGYKPLLVVKYATHNQVSRGKRSRTCDPISECCKRDLVIRFHDIHMPEVYEPRNLSIGYCFGSCVETHQFTYNHTILKERRRLIGSFSQPTMSEQLKSCCVPLVLKDTFLITIEGNEFVHKVVPKVIVETCGCM